MLIESLWLVLAQAPTSAAYIHPGKLIGITVAYALWVLFAQWMDKDTIAVNTYRQIWNIFSVAIGLVSLLLLLLIPVFLGAIGAFAILNLAFMITYVVHRNGLVVEEDKVCTAAHLHRLMTQGFRKGKGEKQLEVKERVVLRDSHEKSVRVPDDPIERQQFALLQDVLFDALARRASRAELSPAGQACKIKLLVDGMAVDRDPLPRAEGDAVVMYIKKLAGLSLEERRKPQKGKLSGAIGQTKYALLARTSGTTAGESLQLTVLGEERDFKIKDLGFTEPQLKQVMEIKELDNGLVVFTAPPGNGLTTTLYSFARNHDAFLQNIQTLELDREMDVENITQHVYVPSEEKPFSAELQRIIRSDPDVVFVMSPPDKPTATIASNAASGKQNVYLGIPSADVLDGLRRWVALVGDAGLVAKSLTAICHQRLVRKLCPTCKAPYKPDPATLKKINLSGDRVLHRPPEPQYDKHGNPIVCPSCQGGGYVGRTGVFTVLAVDDDLRAALRRGASGEELKSVLLKKPGLGIQQHALQKVLDGVTSIDEVVRATRPPVPSGSSGAAAPATRPTPRPPASGTPAKK